VNSPASHLAAVQCHAKDQVVVLALYATHACRLDEASAAQTDTFIATSTCLSSTTSQATVTTVGGTGEGDPGTSEARF
jgi:hypothetical protein